VGGLFLRSPILRGHMVHRSAKARAELELASREQSYMRAKLTREAEEFAVQRAIADTISTEKAKEKAEAEKIAMAAMQARAVAEAEVSLLLSSPSVSFPLFQQRHACGQ
jgi:hypothetical protein